MEQLQELEHVMLDGDLNAIASIVETLQASTDLEIIYEAAELLAHYGFLTEANRLYDILLLHLPDEAQLKIDRARILLEIGEEDEALLLLTSISSAHEEYVQALLVLADYYHMTGMAEAALMKVKDALELAPHEPIVQFAYAELLVNAGRYSEAVHLYINLYEASQHLPGVDLQQRIAETYSAGAAYEEAIPFYERALEDDQNPDLLFGAAYAYYQSGYPQRTVEWLTQLVQLDEDYFSAYMLGGQAYLALFDEPKAYEWFLKGLKRDEFDKELQLSAGKCALKLGQVEQAITHLQEALVLDPEYMDAYITLASVYNQLELDDQLQALLRESQEWIEELPLLKAFQAYSLERLERFEEAYTAYQHAYDGMKEDVGFLDRYARFLLEEGRRTEAIEVVRSLLTLAPGDADWNSFLEGQIDEEV